MPAFFMKKLIILLLSFIATIVLWDYQDFKVAGGFGFIGNNLGWLLILLVISYSCYGRHIKSSFSYYSFIKLSITGIIFSIIPFLFASKLNMEVSWLLPFGLIGAWLFLIALLQYKILLNQPDIILKLIVFSTSVEIVLGYGYLLHRLAMDYTSGVNFQAPNLDINFNQRNLYASFLSTGLISSLYLLFHKRYNQKYKPLLLITLFAGTFLLFITESRVGIYSFIIGCLFIGASYLQSNWQSAVKYIAAIAVCVISSYGFMSFFYGGAEKDFSKTTHREFIYKTSIDAILKKPVFGHGLGSFSKIYTESASQRIQEEALPYIKIQGRPENLSHPHNELLYWGVQGGLVSIIGLIVLALSIYLNIFKLDIIKQLRYFALLAPISLHLMVELPFYISTVHLIIFVSLIAFLLIDSKSVKEHSLKKNTGQYIAAFGVMLLMVTSITIPQNIYNLNKAVRFQTALNSNIQDLDSIKYSIGWHNELSEAKLRYYANIAAKQGKKEPIIKYIRFLENYNQKYPILQNYFNLYFSYVILNEPEKADKMKLEVERLYKGVKEAENWLKTLDKNPN